MPDDRPKPNVLRVADLPQSRATSFHLTPTGPERAAIARTLDILGIRKLDFRGTLNALGKSDWRIEATLGATVEQACVVTLDPVVTRIDQPVTRLFIKDLPALSEEEAEMPEDENQEALEAEIDLDRVMTEALALALPDYPRKDGAALEQQDFSAPGVAPLTDDDIKPFAGLAGLKEKLEKGE